MKKTTFVRRLSALMMAAAMLLSTVQVLAVFSDTSGHWAVKILAEWQDKGFIDGYGDGSFRPDGTMTRAGFVKLVNRALGFTAESAISFSDVKESDWFSVEVARAVAAGYAQGSGGAFQPNRAVTRAEAAVMIARALGLSANEAREHLCRRRVYPRMGKGRYRRRGGGRLYERLSQRRVRRGQHHHPR